MRCYAIVVFDALILGLMLVVRQFLPFLSEIK